MIKKYFYAGGFCFVLTLCLCLALGLTGCNPRVTETVYYATPGNPQQWATNGNATDGNAVDNRIDRGEPVYEMAESTPDPTPMTGPDPTTTPVAVEVTVPPVQTQLTPTPQQTGEPVEKPIPVTPEPTAPPKETVNAALVPPEYVGAGEYNGLSAILTAIHEHYSLRDDPAVGAKYAAQLVDWYIETDRSQASVYMGVLGWLDRVGVFSPEERVEYFKSTNYMARLDGIYSLAVTLYGEDGKALLDAGSYVPANFPYAMTDIDAVFGLVYDALGEIKPQSVRLCLSDGVDIITAPAGTLTPETLGKALVDANILEREVSVLHREDKDGTLRLDFSKAFLAQLKELDREREEELIRILVNTISENLGYERMYFTVQDEPLKTYKTYKDPLTRE